MRMNVYACTEISTLSFAFTINCLAVSESAGAFYPESG